MAPSALLSWMTDAAGREDIAVRETKRAVTYGALREGVLATAAALRAAGVNAGDRVAIALPKSIAALECLLACLVIGAAYVPLDRRAPAGYLRMLLRDLAPRLAVVTPEIATSLKADAANPPAQSGLPPLAVPTQGAGASLLLVDEPRNRLDCPESPNDLAAILYTSGSTGVPKGIMLSTANISCFTEWAGRTFAVASSDQVSSHAPFHFDLSLFDIFCTLAAHGTLHIPDETTLLFPGALRNWIADAAITVWYSVPAALVYLSARQGMQGLTSLRQILFAGEVFPVPALRRLMTDLPGAQYVNLYGPTETNVCTWHRLASPPESDLAAVPIGLQCDHYEVSIRDETGQTLPDGETGEICVTGPGVMTGYWQQPALTASSRLPGRDASYRTGDFGYRRDDGQLMYSGRRDQQVKSRGQRIELVTLENTLNAHPAVREAVVIPAAGVGGTRLLVFATPREAEIDTRILQSFVANHLPAAYVPHRINWLSELPRSFNGKTDRAALRDLARNLPDL